MSKAKPSAAYSRKAVRSEYHNDSGLRGLSKKQHDKLMALADSDPGVGAMLIELGILLDECGHLLVALEAIAEHDGERYRVGEGGVFDRKPSPQEIAVEAIELCNL
jgi:hypothetical protein